MYFLTLFLHIVATLVIYCNIIFTRRRRRNFYYKSTHNFPFLVIFVTAKYGRLFIPFSVYFFGWILYWIKIKKYSLGMNLVMSFYVLTEFIVSLQTMTFALYFIVFWRPNEGIYNAYWISFTAGISGLLYVIEPLVACFLGIDRCLCFMFPLKHSKFWERIVFCILLICIFVFSVIYIKFHFLVGWPSEAETLCRSFACLIKNSPGQVYLILRYITSVASVFIGIFLFFSLKSSISVAAKNNQLVIITVFLTIIFDFFPHLLSLCLIEFVNINLTKLIGTYSILLSAANTVICGFLYYKSFRSSNTVNVNDNVTTF